MHDSDPSRTHPVDHTDSFLREYFEGIYRDEERGEEPEEPDMGEPAAAGQAAPASSPLADSPAAISPSQASGEAEPPHAPGRRGVQPLQLATSTLLSLVMVLGLLLAARLLVPSLVESIRYGWYRGQLRAEYELSGERLQNVSLDSLAEVSQLVSQRVGASVVHINLLRDEESLGKFEALLGLNTPSMRLVGQGSGFVIDSDGYIITNQHVLEGSGRIEVTFSDGRRLPAHIVGVDPMTDLAVLKVEATGLLAAEWGNSDDVVVGTPVWAAGSPFGLQQTITFGIISGKHRVDFRGTRYEGETVRGGTAYGDMMQSDVALNPGNSGGPLSNSLGQVVGVNAAILGETYRGVSFSIPSKVARRVAAALIEQGEVPRGWLGVAMEDLAENERFDPHGVLQPGVRVKGFPRHAPSPAKQAGIAIDDIIVEFQQQAVMNQVELRKLIGETEVGSSAQLTVLRENQRLTFEVVIARRQMDPR
ncbi:MAG: trypsin-like peptidase domain-containing protein [Planctomycetales bacterium]|nr:trypsin-like peptidase domain-containing protein [Planctomycetales bacterium]